MGFWELDWERRIPDDGWMAVRCVEGSKDGDENTRDIVAGATVERDGKSKRIRIPEKTKVFCSRMK